MSTISAFRQIPGQEGELDRLQSNVSQFTQPLVTNPLLKGRLIEDIALSTTEVLIDHKLGAAYQGWIITNKNAAETVYVSSTNLTKRFLALTASGTTTVSIWVF